MLALFEVAFPCRDAITGHCGPSSDPDHRIDSERLLVLGPGVAPLPIDPRDAVEVLAILERARR